MGESLKLGRMINFMVALRLGCKVGYTSSDFDLNVKVVDYKLHHEMSVILVEMEVLNGCYIVVSCLGLRHEDSVQMVDQTALYHFYPFILFYKGFI